MPITDYVKYFRSFHFQHPEWENKEFKKG